MPSRNLRRRRYPLCPGVQVRFYRVLAVDLVHDHDIDELLPNVLGTTLATAERPRQAAAHRIDT